MKKNIPMKVQHGTELVLERGQVWVNVGSITVLINKGEEGVSVDLYPLNGDDRLSLAEAWATYAEAECDEPLPPEL